MPTIISDAIEHAGPPLSTDRHRELLAKSFGPEADFYLKDGTPYVVYPMWDYAEYWGPGPARDTHPFVPLLGGVKVSEDEFRARVRGIHGF
jgi:hypothetical protein